LNGDDDDGRDGPERVPLGSDLSGAASWLFPGIVTFVTGPGAGA